MLIEDALNVVGLRGEEVLEKYPHQLSGGQRQRIMVARAYMLRPRLIVADEPVSMVDASLRAMILDIMLRLRDEHGISFLYITHDLSTAYQIGDDIHPVPGHRRRAGPHRRDREPQASLRAVADRIDPGAEPRHKWTRHQAAPRRRDAAPKPTGAASTPAVPIEWTGASCSNRRCTRLAPTATRPRVTSMTRRTRLMTQQLKLERLPLAEPRPDNGRRVDWLMGRTRQGRTPLTEYLVDGNTILRPVVTGLLGRRWEDSGPDRASQAAYLDNFIEFWYRMGYDFVRFERG